MGRQMLLSASLSIASSQSEMVGVNLLDYESLHELVKEDTWNVQTVIIALTSFCSVRSIRLPAFWYHVHHGILLYTRTSGKL